MPVLLPRGGGRGQNGHGYGRGRNGGCIGGHGCGGRGGPLLSRKQPKAPPPLPAMSCHDKQADLPLSRCQGAMIKACRPLLVFSRISSTMVQMSLPSLLSALAAKTGAGGRSNHSRQCPRRCPLGGGTLQKSKSSAAAAPTATSTLTARVMDQPMREDDVEVGVPLTTMMMTMVATMTVRAPPRCPMGSGTSSSPPSKETRRNMALWGSRCPP
jgi:hypothetical protein